MEKAWTSIYDLGPDYTVTFCADGNAPRGRNTVAPSVIGQLVAIPVKINNRKKTCYMGVGEYSNGKYNVLTTSTMSGPEKRSPALRRSRSASGGRSARATARTI